MLVRDLCTFLKCNDAAGFGQDEGRDTAILRSIWVGSKCTRPVKKKRVEYLARGISLVIFDRSWKRIMILLLSCRCSPLSNILISANQESQDR